MEMRHRVVLLQFRRYPWNRSRFRNLAFRSSERAKRLYVGHGDKPPALCMNQSGSI
jgi:hypothetical protein